MIGEAERSISKVLNRKTLARVNSNRIHGCLLCARKGGYRTRTGRPRCLSAQGVTTLMRNPLNILAMYGSRVFVRIRGARIPDDILAELEIHAPRVHHFAVAFRAPVVCTTADRFKWSLQNADMGEALIPRENSARRGHRGRLSGFEKPETPKTAARATETLSQGRDGREKGQRFLPSWHPRKMLRRIGRGMYIDYQLQRAELLVWLLRRVGAIDEQLCQGCGVAGSIKRTS